MKAIYIREATGPNPAFSVREQIRAIREGRPYDIPHSIVQPVGFVNEHPDAWRHCVPRTYNEPPIAVPGDDECRQMVNAAMKRRQIAIRNLAAVLKQSRPSDPMMVKHYNNLRRAYADELNEIDPVAFPLDLGAEFDDDEDDDTTDE